MKRNMLHRLVAMAAAGTHADVGRRVRLVIR